MSISLNTVGNLSPEFSASIKSVKSTNAFSRKVDVSGMNLCKRLGLFSILISSGSATETTNTHANVKQVTQVLPTPMANVNLLERISDAYSDFIKTYWIYDYQIKLQPGEKWSSAQILALEDRIRFFSPNQISKWNLTNFEACELDTLKDRIMAKWSSNQIHQLNLKNLDEERVMAIGLKRDDDYGYVNTTWINTFSSEQIFSVMDKMSLEELREISNEHFEKMNFSNVDEELAKKLQNCCLSKLSQEQQQALSA